MGVGWGKGADRKVGERYRPYHEFDWLATIGNLSVCKLGHQRRPQEPCQSSAQENASF